MLTLFGLTFLPGFVILVCGRARLRYAMIGAFPVSYGVVTITSYVFGKIGLRWDLTSYLVSSALTAAVLGVIAFGVVFGDRRQRLRRRRTASGDTVEVVAAEDNGPPEEGQALRILPPAIRSARGQRLRETVWYVLPGIAVVLSAWAIGTMILNEISHNSNGLNNIFQGWDAHWHANYLRYIAETGIASPDDAGLLRNVETGATLYYPSAWHAIAALVYHHTGITVSGTYNVVQVGCAAMFFPLGVATLAYAITHRRTSLPFASCAAATAALMTPLFPGLPFVEVMVAATPSAAANGLAGAVVLLIIAAVKRPRLILPASLGLIGVGGIHPSGLVTAAIFVIFYWLFDLLWRPERGRVKDLLPLSIIAILGALTLLPQFLTISSEAGEISAFSFQTNVSTIESLWNSMALQVRHVQDWGVRWVLLAIALIGIGTLIYRRVLWPLGLWIVYIVICMNAMSVFVNPLGGWIRAAGSVYYNDPRRVGVILAILVACFAGIGVTAVAHGLLAHGLGALLRKVRGSHTDANRQNAGALRLVATFVALISVGAWAVQAAPEYAVAAGNNQRGGLLVDDHDLQAFDWLAKQPGAYDGKILVNADEGSGWMYATNGLPATARHYLAVQKSEKNIVYLMENVDTAGADPQTDAALRQLGVRYLYVSPGPYWHFQKPARAFMEADHAPGLQLLYVDRQIRIYGVRAAFAPGELEEVAAHSPFPPEHAQRFTRATERGN